MTGPANSHSRFKSAIEWFYLVFHGIPAALVGCREWIALVAPWAACVNWFPWALGAAIGSLIAATGLAYYRWPLRGILRWMWVVAPPAVLVSLAIWTWLRPESDPPLRWTRIQLRDIEGRPQKLDADLQSFDVVVHGLIRSEQLLKGTDNRRLVARRIKSGYEEPDGRLAGENYIPLVSNTVCRCPLGLRVANGLNALIGAYAVTEAAPSRQMLETIDDEIAISGPGHETGGHRCRLLVLVFPCDAASLSELKQSKKLESLIIPEWSD